MSGFQVDIYSVGKIWFPDVRPGDLIRIKRKLCCGNVKGTYSLLYKVVGMKGNYEAWPECMVQRLDQHAKDKDPYLLSLWYLYRGTIVKRTYPEKVAHLNHVRAA